MPWMFCAREGLAKISLLRARGVQKKLTFFRLCVLLGDPSVWGGRWWRFGWVLLCCGRGQLPLFCREVCLVFRRLLRGVPPCGVTWFCREGSRYNRFAHYLYVTVGNWWIRRHCSIFSWNRMFTWAYGISRTTQKNLLVLSYWKFKIAPMLFYTLHIH